MRDLAPRLALLLALAAAAAPAAATGRAPEAILEEAIETYTAALETRERERRLEGFRRAALLFEAAAASGLRSAELYTNLGSAALQAERLGDAVLAYRRALALDAGHPRALQNLQHARSLLPSWVPRPESRALLDTFFFWHRTLARPERVLASALCFGLLALLLAAGIRFDWPALRSAAWLPGLAWAALLASLALDPGEGAREEAVVTAEEVVARAADSALAPRALPAPLPGGAEVRVVEARPPWLRVRLANGRDAWVPASSVARVAVDGRSEED